MPNSYKYLQVEPYTYISKKENEVLFYNTLSGESYTTINHEILRITEELLNQNFRIIPIEKQTYENKDFLAFTDVLKEKYMGDLLSNKLSHENAIQFDPFFELEEEKEGNNFEEEIKDNFYTKYLFELSVYINGSCPMNCHFCKEAYKQFNCCTKNNDGEIDINFLSGILNNLKSENFRHINILGGNIFHHSKFKALLEILKNYNVNFYCSASNYLRYSQENQVKFHKNHAVIFISSPQNLENDISELDKTRFNYEQTQFLVPVSSEQDWLTCHNMQQMGIPVMLSPYYNHKNLAFFKENVFMDYEDILEPKISYLDIHRNRFINSNFFGKMYIKNNGQVYSNMNTSAIGNIYKDNINKLTQKELIEKSAWLKTRNEEPCHSCIYQYLCPPTSNYEYALNRANLCNLKENKN